MATKSGADLGKNVLALIRLNFGESTDARTKFAELFDRPSASIWPWVNGNRQGIPATHSDRFEGLIASGELQLVGGTTLEDYVRPAPRKKAAASQALRRNDDLLSLIWSVVRDERLGPAALESLMSDSNFVERKRTPALLFRWAYHDGGVPRSYHENFSNALIRSGIAEKLLGYTGADDEAYDIKVTSFFAQEAPRKGEAPSTDSEEG